MNRIEEMIREMCPDGVRRVRLGDVCLPLVKGALDMRNLPENGMYPVFNSGKEITGFYNEFNNDCEAITIASRGEYAGYISYTYGKFWAGVLCYPYKLKEDANAVLKYIYYILKSYESDIMNRLVSRGGIPAINKKDLEKYEIPLPPLPIQQEIVKILDSFTALQQNLEDELKLRQKQYEHYREKLLTFEDGECEWKKLEDIVDKDCCISYGIVQPGEDTLDGIPVVRPVDLIDTIIHNVNLKRTTKEISDSYKKTILAGGEILLCVRGTTGIVSLAGEDLAGCNVTRGITPIKIMPDINTRFVFYLFKSNNIQDKIENNTNGAGLRQINMKDLRKITFPIPSKDKQLQITQILDNFESLISNLKTEIELRKKQYEYYREKLLTF